MAQVESKPRATSDPEARKRVLKRIESEGIEFLLLLSLIHISEPTRP